MSFSPRLAQILILLINNKQAVTVNQLAVELHLSRRTIFRELKNVHAILKKYQLTLNTGSAKGIWLEGTKDNQRRLLDELELTACFDPKNRDDRRKKLILAVLQQPCPQKLFYYAALLQVSETTVSNDMEVIARWFERWGLQLIRKPGFGIELLGTEQQYRKALLRFIYQSRDQDFFHSIQNIAYLDDLFAPGIVTQVMIALEQMDDDAIKRLTESSYVSLIIYLAIMIDRISQQKTLQATEMVDRESRQPTRSDMLAAKITTVLEQQIKLIITMPEINDLATYIKGLQSQYVDSVPSDDNEYHLICMVFEMIDCYDAAIAHDLKLDQDFITAMVAHLRPTIARLHHGMEIQNPFLHDIKTQYAAVFHKTKIAVNVIASRIGAPIPEDETGFLALHFGAAVLRLENKQKLGRKVRAGVVCTSGIGISRLLLSRLSTAFHDEITAVALSQDQLTAEQLQQLDFVIASLPLQALEKPVVHVHPMLPQTDVERIAAQIEHCTIDLRHNKHAVVDTGDMLPHLNEWAAVSKDISAILDDFDVYDLDSKIEFEAMLTWVSNRLGASPASAQTIYQALQTREEIATQVIAEYGFTLLHARTSGVEQSKFIVLRPIGKVFEQPHFQQSQAVVVIVIPDNHLQNQPPAGSISSGLFDNEAFLTAVKEGTPQKISQYMQYYLREYFVDYLKNNYQSERTW